MSIENRDPAPQTQESTEVNPEAVTALAHEGIAKLQNAETQSDALDCVLDLKMQCMSQDVPFDQVQEEVVAGLGSQAKSVAISVIQGIVTNPQGFTAVGQLLS